MNRFFKIALVFLGILFVYSIYMGILYNIRFEEKENPEFYFLYKDMTGAYSKSGKIMDEIYNDLILLGINSYKGFGIYFDNPKEVEESNLRSKVGCIIENKDIEKLGDLKEKYKFEKVNSKKQLFTHFIYKNKLSVIISVLKVYPVIEKYLEKNNLKNGPVMEIYNIPENRIEYYIDCLDK